MKAPLTKPKLVSSLDDLSGLAEGLVLLAELAEEEPAIRGRALLALGAIGREVAQRLREVARALDES